MSYALTIQRESFYLHAVVTGDNTAENKVAYMREIRDRCKQENCFIALIEEKLSSSTFSELETFSMLVEEIPDMLGVFEAVAYIDSRNGFHITKFAENVAVNRGIPVRAFQNVEDGLNWLKLYKEKKQNA